MDCEGKTHVMAKKVGPALLKPGILTGQTKAAAVIRKESAHSIRARGFRSPQQAGYMNASFTYSLPKRPIFPLQTGAGPYMRIL
mgnify:CR=1 FL=1